MTAWSGRAKRGGESRAERAGGESAGEPRDETGRRRREPRGGVSPAERAGAFAGEAVFGQGGRFADAVAASSSRRGFLARLGTAVLGVAGAKTVASLVAPGEAEAYHFCGHIYTTDSCPHPTGLPRIDPNGFPLKAKDGRAVDDLGRYIDVTGAPVDEDGLPLTDGDGLRLPTASRTRVCDVAAEENHFKPHIDGAWYRCCGGHVRKLVDCCGYVRTRVNGDKALTGYCYHGRKVFCVMYYDTNVKC